MTCLEDIERRYEELYKELRKYIWPYPFVEKLAEFEVASYNRFPDFDKMKSMLHQLSILAKRYVEDDEDLDKAFSKFEEDLDSIENPDEFYGKLKSVNEVIPVEHRKEFSEEVTTEEVTTDEEASDSVFEGDENEEGAGLYRSINEDQASD